MITGTIVSMCDALALEGELIVKDGPDVVFGPLAINAIETDFTIDDLVEYSNKDLTFEIYQTGSLEPIYTNVFYFPSNPDGTNIDYADLIFYIRHSTFTCDGPEVFCGFYAIQYPCSTKVCVYNTTNSNNDHIYYKFNDVVKVGENACHEFNTYGTFSITQKINDNQAFPGCCGQSAFSSLSCTTQQEIVIKRYLPEVSILKDINDDCCEGCGCYDANTQIIFNPDIHLKETACCSNEIENPVDCSTIDNFIKLENVILPSVNFTFLTSSVYVSKTNVLSINRRNNAEIPIKFVINQNIYCLCQCNGVDSQQVSDNPYGLVRNDVVYDNQGARLRNESINNGPSGIELASAQVISSLCDSTQVSSFENILTTLDYVLAVSLNQTNEVNITIPFSGYYYKSPNCEQLDQVNFSFDVTLNVKVQIPSFGVGTITLTLNPSIPSLYII